MDESGSINFWRDRNVFVTGATGLLGSWLTQYLVSRQANVVCLVRDWVPTSEFVRSKMPLSAALVWGDVTDAEQVERIVAEYEVNTVFHLAAQTIVGIANSNPVSTFSTNIAGTWAILEACRKSKTVTEIVVASSDKAYGQAETLPYTEKTPLNPVYPYDVSKACADLISRSYGRTFGLPVAVTRCGNLFGGGDLNWNRLIPGTVRSLIRGESPPIRSSGTFVRDYLYVEDAVDAYTLLAQHLNRHTEWYGEAFNFSYEMKFTVKEIVHKIIAAMGSNLEPTVLNKAQHEIEQQFLDSTKSKTDLSWVPQHSFDSALLKTIDWYKDYFQNEPAM